ncbi:MAG: hypothetical protein KKG59_04990 [Nanoarchaeota archaeon]|nr:hypothetical protein [Nanoarchaeota archaeon]
MATLGDSVGGLFDQFSFIFIFLLVFAVVFGILSYVNPLKDERRGIYGIISFVISIIVAVSSKAVIFIKTMTTWFFVLGLFVFLIMFVVGIFGVKEGNWLNLIKDGNVHSWIIILSIIIVLFSLGNAFGEGLLKKGSGSDNGVPEYNPDDYYPDDIPPPDDYYPGDYPVQQQNAESDFGDNVLKTFINPKVLGMLLVFMIALFTVIFLTRPLG